MGANVTFDQVMSVADRLSYFQMQMLWGLQSTDLTKAEMIKSTDQALNIFQTNGLQFVDTTNRVAVIESQTLGKACPANATTALGTGAVGDLLHLLVVTVNTALTSSVSIKDGALSSVLIVPAAVASGIGVISIPMDSVSVSGGWSIITGVGVTVWAVGRFTA